MPWTLVHPAAVLPLRRLTPRPLNFPALVIGSMTPDIGYYINRFDLTNFAHTLPGSFIACLPTGLIMLLIFYFFARPVCYVLPSPHRQALLPLCPDIPTRLLPWAIILLSLLLGVWTHNFWDAFTHEHGWFVDRIPWLQQPVGRIGATTIYRFLFLQELSTIVGFAIVVFVYWVWLRRQPARKTDSEAEGWRYFFWFAVLALSFLVAVPAAAHYAATIKRQGFLVGRSTVFWTAIYSSDIAVSLSLLGTTIIYLRRKRVNLHEIQIRRSYSGRRS